MRGLGGGKVISARLAGACGKTLLTGGPILRKENKIANYRGFRSTRGEGERRGGVVNGQQASLAESNPKQPLAEILYDHRSGSYDGQTAPAVDHRNQSPTVFQVRALRSVCIAE